MPLLPSPQTLFAMFKTEIEKWPDERLSFEDQYIGEGLILRNIRIDNSAIVVKVILDRDNARQQILFPQLSLQ